MIRNILIVTVASFFLSVVCLTVAIGMAGPDLITQSAWGWGGGPWHWGSHRHGFSWSHTYSDDTSARREEPWSFEELQVDVPADVHFTQADGAAKLTVSGPQSAIDHLIIHDGHLTEDARYPLNGEKLVVQLTAPKVTRFTLNGSGHLDISGYRQDSLALKVNGDGDLSAQGQAKAVTVDISGSGGADLGSLATDSANVTISGSGTVKVGPKSSARFDISGSGDVTLTSRPEHVESHVSGSGKIEQDDETPPPKPEKSGTTV